MRILATRLVLTLPALALCVASGAARLQDTRQPETEPGRALEVKSVFIDVVGRFLIAPGYRAGLRLTNTGPKYVLEYSSRGLASCPRKIEALEVERSIAEGFITAVSALEDRGQRATCCDHPYTVIEVTYSDGSSKKIRLGYDLIRRHLRGEAAKDEASGKLFEIVCGSEPQPTSKGDDRKP